MKTRRRDPLGRKNNYPLWARCCLLKRQNALVGGASRRSGFFHPRSFHRRIFAPLASSKPALSLESVTSLWMLEMKLDFFRVVQGWWKRFFLKESYIGSYEV